MTIDRRSGNWTMTNCNTTMGYLCKVSSDKPDTINGKRNGHCPDLNENIDSSLSWIDLHPSLSHCYWPSTERRGGYIHEVMAYSDASFHCRRRNGTLVWIHSSPESKLLTNRLSNDVPDFHAWIGLQTDPNGQVVWEDRSPLDFSNGLSTKHLNSTDLNDDSGLFCATIKYDGTWSWNSCLGSEKHFFVCQTIKIYLAE